MKDYYKTLRLPSSASQEEIKRSYRRLAMVYHPDRSHNPDANDIFSEINEAYEVLGDPILKKQYDDIFKSDGQQFVDAQIFQDHFEKTRNVNRTERVYRATRKTKDIITPHIISVYKYSSFFTLFLMTLFLIDFALPSIRIEEKLTDKAFGDGKIMEYIFKTPKRSIIIDQDDYGKLKIGQKFILEKSSIFHFDTHIRFFNSGAQEKIELPGNFFKYFNIFIVVVFVFSVLTIKAKKEQDILQYGTANFYLSLIIIISALVVY